MGPVIQRTLGPCADVGPSKRQCLGLQSNQRKIRTAGKKRSLVERRPGVDPPVSYSEFKAWQFCKEFGIDDHEFYLQIRAFTRVTYQKHEIHSVADILNNRDSRIMLNATIEVYPRNHYALMA